MNKNIFATIITIGDELLIGQTIDTNSAWIAQQLNALGIEIHRRVAIADKREDMMQSIKEELEKVQLLIITGGLGPTSDDITKPVLCEAFGGNLVMHEPTLEQVKSIFTKRNRPMLDSNLKQAELPDNCTVLPNQMGTAPGMLFHINDKLVISLPGVPFEMIHIMETQALPMLRAKLVSGAVVHRTITTAGEGESFIAEQIKEQEAALPPHIKLAYLPQPGMVRLRLTAHGTDELSLIREVELHRDGIAAQIEQFVISFEDLPLEHIIGKDLTAAHKTIALAESCTGGYISHRITQIMGSAQYFMGCVVSYNTEVKKKIIDVKDAVITKYGVVSEEVAVAMAEGTRKNLDADYGFGITGLLSAGGDDSMPVGTVCIAVSDKEHTKSKTFKFHMDRLRNKELAAQYGLLYIWKFINGKW